MSPQNSMFNHGGVPNGTRDSLEPWFQGFFQGGVNQSASAETLEVSQFRPDGRRSDQSGLAAGVELDQPGFSNRLMACDLSV